LQYSSQTNGDDLNNVRRETSRAFRNKKRRIGGMEAWLHSFLTSALDGCEWSASRQEGNTWKIKLTSLQRTIRTKM